MQLLGLVPKFCAGQEAAPAAGLDEVDSQLAEARLADMCLHVCVQVKKLHEQQDWLKAQYEKQHRLQDGIARDPNAPIRPPVRHVSF